MTEPDYPSAINEAKKGDSNAFETLFAAHLPRLAAFIRMKAGGAILGRESVDDLVQTVCREVLEDIDEFDFRGETAFRNYLFLQATRKIMDRGRFYRAERRDVGAEVDISGLHDSELLESYGTFYSPTRNASAKEEVQRLEGVIAMLPENQRIAVAFSRVLELPYNEVADRMEITESAARALVARGLTTLARKLTELDGGQPG